MSIQDSKPFHKWLLHRNNSYGNGIFLKADVKERLNQPVIELNMIQTPSEMELTYPLTANDAKVLIKHLQELVDQIENQ